MSIPKAILYTMFLVGIGAILSIGFLFAITLLDLNTEKSIHYSSVARILTKVLQYSIILFLVFKLSFRPSNLLIKLKKIKWETLVLILIISFGLEIVTKFILDIKLLVNTNQPETISEVDYSGNYLWVYDLIRAVILAPIFEELFFRKFLFTGLLKKYSFGVSAIVSSICFSLLHIPNWLNLAPTFLFGIICCWIYLKTKNILYAILLHFVGNLTVLISSFYNKELSILIQEITYIWMYGVILFLGLGMILFGLRKLKRASIN